MASPHHVMIAHAQTILEHAMTSPELDEWHRHQLAYQLEHVLKQLLPLPPSPIVDDLQYRLAQTILTHTPELTLELIATYG